MELQVTSRHHRDFSIEWGDVFENTLINMEESWNEFIQEDNEYKQFNDLSEDTRESIISIVQDYELEGKTFYSIDDWVYHFEHYGDIESDDIDNGDDLGYDDTIELMNHLMNELKDNKVFDIYVNPLLHAVQSEVNQLKTNREMRKQKAERMIENIRIGLDKSLRSYDSLIEQKLTSTITNN